MKTLIGILLTVAFVATATPAFAQNDPHHPEETGTEVVTGDEAVTPDDLEGPKQATSVAACPGPSPIMGMTMGSPAGDGAMAMMPMMQMQGMQMMQMQMMQGTQLEMMRTMQMMQNEMLTTRQMLDSKMPRGQTMP